jgi:hypothetical protein
LDEVSATGIALRCAVKVESPADHVAEKFEAERGEAQYKVKQFPDKHYGKATEALTIRL